MPINWDRVDRGCEGLQVLEDGTLLFSALRAQGRTYLAVMDFPDNPNHIREIKVAKIRLTVAVPLDHTTRAKYKIPCDPTSNIPTGPITRAAEDIAPNALRQHYVKAGENFKRYLRRNSWPQPQSIPDVYGDPTPKVADKLGTGGKPENALRDDTLLLNSQAFRILSDIGRPGGEKSILLKGICPTWKPGAMIGNIGAVAVNKAVKEVIFHTSKPQLTELVLC